MKVTLPVLLAVAAYSTAAEADTSVAGCPAPPQPSLVTVTALPTDVALSSSSSSEVPASVGTGGTSGASESCVEGDVYTFTTRTTFTVYASMSEGPSALSSAAAEESSTAAGLSSIALDQSSLTSALSSPTVVESSSATASTSLTLSPSISSLQISSSPAVSLVASTSSGSALTAPSETSKPIVNGVGRLPALGFNSWNAYHGNVNETVMMRTANAFVSLGLKDAGYEYVNLDDYWSNGRDKNGELKPDLGQFPDGIDGMVAKIHDLGLKAGIYSSASVDTCGWRDASLGKEMTDATTFAKWGIDYLKYDNCLVPKDHPEEHFDEYDFCTPQSDADRFNGQGLVNGSCAITSKTAPPGYDWKTSNTYARYSAMGKAIKAQTHPILFSLCSWGWGDVRSWGYEFSQSWRIAGDIQSSWGDIMGTLNQASFMADSVDFFSHNDLDILEVGNGGLSDAECRTHFAMWAVLKSPLLIGTDLPSLSPELVAILKNKYLLAFNQDPVYGKPATPFNWNWTWNRTKPASYWSGQSSSGVLVILMNPNDSTETMTAQWSEVPELGGSADISYEVTDIWTGTTTCVKGGFTRSIASHDTAGGLVGKRC